MEYNMKKRQSIAVIGAGAVGGYYGGRLAEAGHDVRFLVRRDYHAVTASGLNVTSPDGDFLLTHPSVASGVASGNDTRPGMGLTGEFAISRYRATTEG